MSSTPTTRLRLQKQGTGDNSGTWGTTLNANVFDLIDAAVAGVASYTLSGSKSLTSNNYASDESRMPFQNITGGTGGTVTVPSVEGKWFFNNQSSGSVIVTTGSGTTATLSVSDAVWVFCDGTNCYTGLTKSYVDAAIASAALGGITSLPAAQGGTGNTSYTVGDLLYASASTTLARLAGVASGNALISGGIGVAPSWGKVGLTTHVSGTLPIANGGTGVTTSTGSGSVVLSASPTFMGTPAAPTATAGTNTTQIATTAFVTTAVTVTATSTITFSNKTIALGSNTVSGTKAQFNTACTDGDFAYTSDLASYATTASLASYATLASPTFTGTPAAPTAVTTTNTTQVATTAFVQQEIGAQVRAAVQIGSTLTPSGSATAVFSSIPATYSAIHLQAVGVSHNSGSSQSLQIEFSPDGSTWSTPVAISAATSGTFNMNAGIFVPAYASGGTIFVAAVGDTLGNIVATDTTRSVATSPSITAMRLSWTAGNFDAGTVKLFGV